MNKVCPFYVLHCRKFYTEMINKEFNRVHKLLFDLLSNVKKFHMIGYEFYYKFNHDRWSSLKRSIRSRSLIDHDRSAIWSWSGTSLLTNVKYYSREETLNNTRFELSKIELTLQEKFSDFLNEKLDYHRSQTPL